MSRFIGTGAAIFAHQRDMVRRQEQNKVVSVFGVNSITSDNYVRNLLDGVPVPHFGPLYKWIWSELVGEEHCSRFFD